MSQFLVLIKRIRNRDFILLNPSRFFVSAVHIMVEHRTRKLKNVGSKLGKLNFCNIHIC